MITISSLNERWKVIDLEMLKGNGGMGLRGCGWGWRVRGLRLHGCVKGLGGQGLMDRDGAGLEGGK